MIFMAKHNRYEQAIDIYHVNKKHRLFVYDPYIVGPLFRKEISTLCLLYCVIPNGIKHI